MESAAFGILAQPLVDRRTTGGRTPSTYILKPEIAAYPQTVENRHPAGTKYEEDGGPSLRRVADVLQSVAASDSLETLLKAVTLNILLGNGDAHGRTSPCSTLPPGL